MTRILLVRHGTTDEVGRLLSGRAAVPLNGEGRAQAERLAERLAREPLRAVYTSPVARARQTAEAVARRHGLATVPRDALAEVDFGEWTGRSIAAMDAVEGWREFNECRSVTRPPGGETMVEVQARAAAELLRVRADHPGAVVAAVTHADVVKAALFHFGGIAADLVLRWSIGPASVTVIDIGSRGSTVVAVNDGGGPPWA